MVFFNWATMQMAAKIVYYGPGLCGKTTNLSYIYAKTSPTSRGEMVSLETESDRTLFFDLLPIEVGTIGGFRTRLQLYTVPGQVFYNTTRKLVLKGVDGIVFVADSQKPMREANCESFRNLKENLAELGMKLDEIPLVLQYNKRDLEAISTMEELEEDLNPDGELPAFESSAINGDGVFETLKEITKLTLKRLRRRMATPTEEPKVKVSSAADSTPPPTEEAPAEQPAAAASAEAPAAAAPPGERPGAVSAAALARAAEEAVSGESETESEAPPSEPEPAGEVADFQDHTKTAPLEGTQPQRQTADGESGDEPAPEPEIEELPAEAEIPEKPPAEEPAAEAKPAEEEPEEPTRQAEVEPAVEPEPFDSPAEEVEVEEPYKEDAEQAAAEPAVEFATSEEDREPVRPPEMKRVHVSSRKDILSELENLREHATASVRGSGGGSGGSSMDLDSLLGQSLDKKRELRRTMGEKLNSDIFDQMREVQIAVRIQDSGGETISSLKPVSIAVGDARSLNELLLKLTVDLENAR